MDTLTITTATGTRVKFVTDGEEVTLYVVRNTGDDAVATWDVADFLNRQVGIRSEGVPGLTKLVTVELLTVMRAQDWLRTL